MGPRAIVGVRRVIGMEGVRSPTFCGQLSKNSEYDQEIPQSQTVDKPMAP